MTGPRLARPEDAEAIARVHVAAWQVAYRGKMPDDFLDAMDVKQRGDAWQRLLEEGGARGRVMFGESPATVILLEGDEEEIVGIAAFGAVRASELVAGEPERDGTGELMMINLEPGSWGKGLAARLLQAATTGLSEAGYDEAVLWVLDTNDRARRFYEKWGWAPDGGEKRDDRPGFSLRELRYRRQL